MNIINNDVESQRIHRNRTRTQIKVADSIKEGVVLNNNLPLQESYNSLMIADSVELPNKLYEQNTKKEKGLAPIIAATVGFMSAMAATTAVIAKSTKDAVNVDLAKKLPSLTRNVCINNEMNQAIYRVVANPSKKTVMAAGGLAVFSSMAFMGKAFCEGFRDVWVKKKESDIHKDLQENLIEVETQSFSGKMQIIRNMLASKAKEFNTALSDKPYGEDAKAFKSHSISFTSKKGNDYKKSSTFMTGLKDFALGVATSGAIVGLGYLSLKNIRNSNKSLKEGLTKIKGAITELADNTAKRSEAELDKENYELANKIDKEKISNLFVDISAEPEFIISTADRMKWGNEEEKQKFIQANLFNVNKSSEKANSALGGSGQDRNAFYSHVSDYKAFLYNAMIDSSNKQFQTLFWGITGAAAATYIGELGVNAYKDVQVKKYNAETELNLQKRLVSTELRNFKSKKDASIKPLCDEFYRQKDEGKPKEELKIVADNILNEIKNGAPYVYA